MTTKSATTETGPEPEAPLTVDEQVTRTQADTHGEQSSAAPSGSGQEPPRARNLAGSTVQQYAVGECLGEGGMGVVYRAQDTRLDRAVALKFPSDAVKDSKNRERLLREARAASGLTSPNIVSIYEVGEFEDAPFIAMEYIEGQRLSDRLRDGPLPVDEALDIVAQVAGALDCAHAAGVIHRDIKSSNLVVTESGMVKVLDFGIAKLVEQDSAAPEPATSTITVSGNIFGTLSFMSPEQALGKPVDHRSDLFSLGVVFYQTLTGQLPFAGANLNEVVDHIVHREPMPVARFNYEVSPEVEAVLRKLLEKDPNLRYQHAKDVQIDLQRIIRDRHPQDATGPSEIGARSGLKAETSGLSRTRALVLDFLNLTPDGSPDTLGASLTETVTADLNSTLALDVVGREAVSELRRLVGLIAPESGTADEAPALEMARKAAAAWLITGSYRRVGESVRVTAKLIDVQEGTIVQTVKLDGDEKDILALEDLIVPELAAKIRGAERDPVEAGSERGE